MAKRFHVNLANPSFGVVDKGKGIVTILETAEPIPPDPPEPVQENSFEWECVFENLTGSAITSVSNVLAEEGYEYWCAHIDRPGDNEIAWSHAAKFPGDGISGTATGQSMDCGIGFGETAGVFVDSFNHGTYIVKVLRRPLPIAADEDSRITGNEFVRVSGNSLNYQWDFGYEYYIMCTSGTLRNFTGTIVTDKTVYDNWSSMHSTHAFITAIDSNQHKWAGFDHKKSDPGNKSFRKIRTHKCDLHSVWRRPWKGTSVTPSEFANEHKRTKNLTYSPPTSITFDWKDDKEYLVIMGDHDGDNEICSAKIITLPELLTVPGVDRHKAGIAASAGAFSWFEFLQTKVGGSKKVNARWGGRLLAIMERDSYFDPVSCDGAPPDSGGPAKLTFESDTPGITKYATETFDLSVVRAEAYVGASWGNDIPDTYNDKYGETMDGIAIPIESNVANREITPTNAYKAETIGDTQYGWYLSVIDETVHTSGIKYCKVTGVSINTYAENGHTLDIRATGNADGDFSIDHNSNVTDNYNDTSASLQDVYDIRTNSLYLRFKDSSGNNYSGIDAEAIISLEFEFNDGTKFPHTIILSAHSGGY